MFAAPSGTNQPAPGLFGVRSARAGSGEGSAAAVMRKPSGIADFISFSSQAPTGMNTASWFSHAVCDWTWVIWATPGRISSSVRSCSSASAASRTASCCQAPSSRLSMFFQTSCPPIFATRGWRMPSSG